MVNEWKLCSQLSGITFGKTAKDNQGFQFIPSSQFRSFLYELNIFFLSRLDKSTCVNNESIRFGNILNIIQFISLQPGNQKFRIHHIFTAPKRKYGKRFYVVCWIL